MDGKNPREGCAALVLEHYHQRRAGVARIGQTWLPVAAYGFSQFSHRLTGQHRTQADSLDFRRILTCGYGFWCIGRTLSIDLRQKGTRLRGGAAAPDPAAYGLSPPLFQPLTAYAARGRISPAPAWGTPHPDLGRSERARYVPDRAVVRGVSRLLKDGPPFILTCGRPPRRRPAHDLPSW
jgi:hypothetical protein